MLEKIKSEAVDTLFKAVLTLQNVEECYQLFSDVCTINEIQAMAQRLCVAKMLTETHTYVDIAEKTGASTATISRVNRSLHYGMDGYNMVFKRMKRKGKS